MNKFKNIRSRAGVTLIELLVAVAITVIVGASIVGALYSGRSAYESGDAVIRKYEAVRVAVDFISRDIASAYIYPAGGGISSWDPSFEYPVSPPGPGGDALEFTALISVEGEMHELRRIWYWVNDDDELMRAEWKLRTGLPATVEVIAENITGLVFEFQSDRVEVGPNVYQKRWYTLADGIPVWNFYYGDDPGEVDDEQNAHQRGRIPRLVRFDITVRDRAGNQETFSAYVHVAMYGRSITIP